ncbi:MAG: hypothetical protein ACP5D0_08245, partial [Hydrogenovibrio sp.]
HGPFTAVTGVRLPYGTPLFQNPTRSGFFMSENPMPVTFCQKMSGFCHELLSRLAKFKCLSKKIAILIKKSLFKCIVID